MKTTILRKLIREVIEASSSSSASTDTQPSSPEADRNDGGDQTSETPEKAVEDYISASKNAVPAKKEEEAKKLASTLRQGGVDTPDKVMATLRNIQRDEEGGQSFADEIIKYQTVAEREET